MRGTGKGRTIKLSPVDEAQVTDHPDRHRMVALEDRNDVVGIAPGHEVHQQRRIAIHPKRAGRREGGLDAMRPPMTQHAAHRPQGVAFLLEVGAETDDELLDALGRRERLELAAFVEQLRRACRRRRAAQQLLRLARLLSQAGDAGAEGQPGGLGGRSEVVRLDPPPQPPSRRKLRSPTRRAK